MTAALESEASGDGCRGEYIKLGIRLSAAQRIDRDLHRSTTGAVCVSSLRSIRKRCFFRGVPNGSLGS